jgi:hypothetical protein
MVNRTVAATWAVGTTAAASSCQGSESQEPPGKALDLVEDCCCAHCDVCMCVYVCVCR